MGSLHLRLNIVTAVTAASCWRQSWVDSESLVQTGGTLEEAGGSALLLQLGVEEVRDGLGEVLRGDNDWRLEAQVRFCWGRQVGVPRKRGSLVLADLPHALSTGAVEVLVLFIARAGRLCLALPLLALRCSREGLTKRHLGRAHSDSGRWRPRDSPFRLHLSPSWV